MTTPGVTATTKPRTAILIAGVPSANRTLYHRIRFPCGDPAAYVELHGGEHAPGEQPYRPRTELIIRDIEVARAKRAVDADAVAAVQDFTPEGGLSSDRETATAQAAAELLRRAHVTRVIADRTLPLSFADEVRKLGIALEYDSDLGVAERRAKDEQEIEWLREAQRITEQTVEWACRLIATADVAPDGMLLYQSAPLTAERMFAKIDVRLLEQGYANETSIVAAGAEGGDCHNRGSGPIHTGVPVIIDIFPRNKRTLYNGDCTRVVVHGDVPGDIAKMHTAVVDAKAASIGAVRAGATADAVHKATMQVINAHGFERALPPPDAPKGFTSMAHGTGHGVGLDVHEPPLIDDGGPPLVAGDCLTIEPGLYSVGVGGIRIEDMVIVTEDGCENLNTIQEGLDWT